MNKHHFDDHLSEFFQTKSFEDELMSKSSTIDRIKFIIKKTEDYYYIYKRNDTHKFKYEDAALLLREMGNKEYENNCFLNAMKFYNKSVAYAPLGSETLALAYGNRSAVCYQMGRYKDCLKNITLAKEFFPMKGREKLIEREFRTVQLMLKENEPNKENEMLLSMRSHDKISTIANCLELKNGSVCTNQDLYPGEIVVTEKPLVMLHSCTYDQCMYCLKKSYSLIACQRCNHAMFCNIDCRQKAFDLYHKYECYFIHYLHNCDVEIWMGIRCALIAMKKFRDTNLLKIWQNKCCNLEYNPIYDCDVIANANDYDVMSLKCLLNIRAPPIQNYPKIPTKFKHNHILKTMFQTAGALGHMSHALKLNSDNIDFFILHFYNHILNSCNFVKNIITNELKYSNSNQYAVHKNNVYTATNRGFSIHGFASFFKISCEPNTSMFYTNSNTLIVKVIKPIRKGDELLGCYQ